MGLTVTISGSSVSIIEKSLKIADKVDERTRCTFSVLDTAGTASFQKGQPVSIVDSTLGTLFTGYVNNPQAVKLPPNAHRTWAIDCVDQTWLADKRTSNKVYKNQYSGTIVADQIQRYLTAEGVTGAFALDWDELETDFAAGTLTNTVATTNASDGNPGDGDLELTLAGTAVSVTETTTSDFSTGTLTNVTAASNSLTPTATGSIKFQCTQSVPGGGNSYTYVKIFVPSGTFTVVNNRYIAYDIWIDSSSPEAKFGVDMVFTDGTTLRDGSVYNDAQDIPPHPKNDLKGVALDQWYHREFWLDNFASKNVAYIMLGCEGDSAGTYTAYFKNINYENGDHSFNQTFFNGTSFNVSPPQQMQTNGYSGTMLSIVNTYSCTPSLRISASYSISAVGILRSSFISWDTTIPANTEFGLKYSIDGGNSYTLCTNNAPLPNLPAGMSLSGKSIQFAEEFSQLAGANPEQPPVLNSLQLTLQPSYNATKSDVLFTTANSTWGAAGTTLTNTTASGGILNLTGAQRNFDDANTGSQTLYGGGATPSNASTTCNQKAFSITTTSGVEARCRMDFAGTYANGVLESDIYLDNANAKVGVVYRTSNWSNYDGNHAYAVECTLTTVKIFRGQNSTASSTGSITQVGSTATVTLSSGNWHHLKVVFNGSSHTVYLDDVQVISATDSTYTGAGYVGLRISNGTGGTYTAQYDNFGVVAALSGTWQSASISLSGASTYGNSVVWWTDITSPSVPNSNTVLLVQSSVDGGSTWQTCTNGGAIQNLTVGQSLSSVNLLLKVTLTTSLASALPAIRYFNVYVLGQFSASGTRVSPSLSLARVTARAGTALVNWNANEPTNTSLAVATSTDGGSTWQNVSSAGATISNIATQPAPVVDTFSADDHTSYTQSNFASGANGTWTWDTANSRLTGSGGTNGTLTYNTALTAADNQVMADFDEADGSGLIANYQSASALYFLQIFDSSGTGSQNIVKLFKRSGGVNTQLGSNTAISFTRGTYHRFILDVQAGVITVSMDGVQLLQQTDGSPLSAGKSGLLLNTLLRCYSLRLQQYGQDVHSLSILTRLTLTSTDPTATPQVLDVQTFIASPSIGAGTLIPSASYLRTFISSNIDDQNKQSNYWWYVSSGKAVTFQARTATPAPWIISSSNSQTIAGQQIGDVLVQNLQLQNNGDLYRNRQVITGVQATASFNETKTGDGSTQTWNVAHPLTTAPVIVLNGQAQTVGVKGVDTGRNFYYQVGSTAIDQDSSGTILNEVDSFSIAYTGSFVTDLVLDNTGGFPGTISQSQMAAIDGSSGIVEAVEDVSSKNMDVTTATTYGNQLLQRYGTIGRTLTFNTLHSGLQPGQQLTAFVPEQNCMDVVFLVLEVDISVTTLASGALQYWFSVIATENSNLGSWVKLFASVFASN